MKKCVPSKINILAYTTGFVLWHYDAGEHVLADVLADGYFNAIAGRMRPGEQVHVSASDGAGLLFIVNTQPVARLRAMACGMKEAA